MGAGRGLPEGPRVTWVSAPVGGVLALPGPLALQRARALVLQQQGRLAPGKETELTPATTAARGVSQGAGSCTGAPQRPLTRSHLRQVCRARPPSPASLCCSPAAGALGAPQVWASGTGLLFPYAVSGGTRTTVLYG